MSEPRHLIIGRVTKPHGVKGEVRVHVITDAPERFYELEHVYIAADEADLEPVRYAVHGVRFHHDLALLRLEGIESREAAAALRGYWVQVALEDAVPLGEGEYYLFQLLGLTVMTEAGEALGTIRDLHETGANNIFIVEGARGELLIPDIPDVVLKIDFEARHVLIRPLPGLLDL